MKECHEAVSMTHMIESSSSEQLFFWDQVLKKQPGEGPAAQKAILDVGLSLSPNAQFAF